LIATWAPVGVAGPTAARFEHSKLTDATGVVGTMLSSSSMSMANKHEESDVQIDQKHKSQIYSWQLCSCFFCTSGMHFLENNQNLLSKNDEKHSRLWTRRPSGQPFWSQEALLGNPSGARKLFIALTLVPGGSPLAPEGARRMVPVSHHLTSWHTFECQDPTPWHPHH